MVTGAFPYAEPLQAQGSASGTAHQEAWRQAAHRPEGWWQPGEAMAAATSHGLPKGCAVMGAALGPIGLQQDAACRTGFG